MPANGSFVPLPRLLTGLLLGLVDRCHDASVTLGLPGGTWFGPVERFPKDSVTSIPPVLSVIEQTILDNIQNPAQYWGRPESISRLQNNHTVAQSPLGRVEVESMRLEELAEPIVWVVAVLLSSNRQVAAIEMNG